MPRVRIGDLLRGGGHLTPDAVEQILRTQSEEKNHRRFGEIVLDAGLVGEDVVYQALAELFGLAYIDLDTIRSSPDAAALLPLVFIRQKCVVPVSFTGRVLTVAFDDKPDYGLVRDIRFITGVEVRAALTKPSALARALKRDFAQTVSYEQILQKFSVVEIHDPEPDMGALERAVEEAPVVALVNAILGDALRQEASDVHIEPQEEGVRVRFRVDGMLYDAMRAPTELKYALLSRIKVMARLDIAERRAPQDGRVRIQLENGNGVDLRVSTLPTLLGEKAVIRILGDSHREVDLARLGFEPRALREIRGAISRPHGMILVTGPTGSGKTTTLYAILKELNRPVVNISTAEDPIEYRMRGVSQVQVNEATGLTFASCLRAFLRQDPDIIMVGEIRDYETAEIAVKAALTGHLLLSTLHTNDAPSTITRLLNMGIEPFLISGSLSVIVAQRLIRKVCANCREAWVPPPASLLGIGLDPEEVRGITLYRGLGCDVCADSGYRGRAAIYEVLPINDAVAGAILTGAGDAVLRQMACEMGMKTLRESAITKLKAGMTTPEEVLRVTPPDARPTVPERRLRAVE